MIPEDLLRQISVMGLPLLTAITLHEWAHGWVASLRGDYSAKMLGRLSLNPVHHIDPIGTLLVPITLIFLGTGFIFGWAKPVPVNANALKNPRFDMALVAVAGPLANILMAVLWGIAGKFAGDSDFGTWLGLSSDIGIKLNIFLAVLNMLPILPLDGGRILSAFLPRRLVYYFDQTEPFGLYILVALMLLGILPVIISPIFYQVLFFISHLLQW